MVALDMGGHPYLVEYLGHLDPQLGIAGLCLKMARR